jgi:hypothetical protein
MDSLIVCGVTARARTPITTEYHGRADGPPTAAKYCGRLPVSARALRPRRTCGPNDETVIFPIAFVASSPIQIYRIALVAMQREGTGEFLGAALDLSFVAGRDRSAPGGRLELLAMCLLGRFDENCISA